jgi:signal transduction histidine kinase/CheY-like chemotaxis protein
MLSSMHEIQPTTGLQVAGRVTAELDRLLVETARGTSVIVPTAALLLAVLLRERIPVPPLVAWVAVMTILSGLRLAIAWRYQKAGHDPAVQARLGRLFVMFTWLTGIGWSALAMLPDALDGTFSLAVIYLAAAGVIMIGANVLIMNRAAMLGYVVPLPLVLLMALNTRPDAGEWSLELSVILFAGLLFMLWVGSQNNRVLRHNINLRLTNEALIEQLRESNREARAASEAKGYFLANMSHEIRTPMNAVIGLTRMLGDTSLDARQRQLVETLHTASDSLLALLNNILDLSKIEASQLQLECTTFHLGTFLDDIRLTMDPLARQKGIELVLAVDRDALPEYVTGDAVRLRQVLINLLSNAIKFTDHGHVMLGVEPVSTADTDGTVAVRFRVEDTGTGIPADKQAVIFENFAQADVSTTRRHGGSGLGLAISRQIIELMGGRLGLVSETGKGTVFHFTVKLANGAGPEQLQNTTAPVTGGLPLRVLLMEDNEFNRFIIRELLSGQGHSVHEADNGIEGLQALAAQDYDVVLMDIQMPVMDGLTASRVIRAAERGETPAAPLPDGLFTALEQRLCNRRLRIVALTANAMVDDRDACLGAGMDSYLTKPFTPEQLAGAVGPGRQARDAGQRGSVAT